MPIETDPAPGAMRALCEIYRELDHDAEIHRQDVARDTQNHNSR